jgi:hypothetical protein
VADTSKEVTSGRYGIELKNTGEKVPTTRERQDMVLNGRVLRLGHLNRSDWSGHAFDIGGSFAKRSNLWIRFEKYPSV